MTYQVVSRGISPSHGVKNIGMISSGQNSRDGGEGEAENNEGASESRDQESESKEQPNGIDDDEIFEQLIMMDEEVAPELDDSVEEDHWKVPDSASVDLQQADTDKPPQRPAFRCPIAPPAKTSSTTTADVDTFSIDRGVQFV